MGNLVIASFALIVRHSIIFESEQGMELFETQKEDIEDWSSDNRDFVKWLNAIQDTVDSINEVKNITRRLDGVEGDDIIEGLRQHGFRDIILTL